MKAKEDCGMEMKIGGMDARRQMVLDRLPESFCEGPFWGNGKMGTVLFIRNGKLCLSVDHMGLWETRETLPDKPRADFWTILRHREEYLRGDPDYVEDTNIFNRAIGRTRLPALSVEIGLGAPVTGFLSVMDFTTAEGTIRLTLKNGHTLTCRIRVDSNTNLLYLEFSGAEESDITVEAKGWDLDSGALEVLRRWEYPACEQRSVRNWFFAFQKFGKKREAVLCGKTQRLGERICMAVSMEVCAEEDAEDMEATLSARVCQYLEQEETFAEEHRKDWSRFWKRADLVVPNERIQEAFWQEMYKLYCNERPDAFPITLQGIWNPPHRMPAWFGDLHNDLNVQSCYWPAYKTGNVELVRPYIDWYSKAVPRFEERAEKLFGIRDAIHIPIMMTPEGYGAGSEWCFWNTLCGPELFVAVDFIWFYEFSRDPVTLKEKIYPFLEKVVHLYQGIAEEGEDGLLHLPFMMSPEYSDGHGIMMERDPVYALASLHYICKKLDEYGACAGKNGQKYLLWSRRLARPEPNETGFPVFAGINHFVSHRHFCHMFPIFPLGEEAHNEVANRSLDTAINRGFLGYAAYSFPYLGIMGARCGRGNLCRTMLEIYCMAFRSRNSFTVNGDPYQNGVIRVAGTNAGESSDAFTLESGFFVITLLCEMFVHRIGQDVWLLPAVPDEWKEASCRDLTIEGGHSVSLTMRNYCLAQARLTAACAEELTFRYPENVSPALVQKNGKKEESLAKDCLRIPVGPRDTVEIFFTK